MSNRADLISQLAASMGAGSNVNASSTKSRFNSKTGTLYCKEVDDSKYIADQAIKHFIGVQDKYRRNNAVQSQQMVEIYQCAIDAIKMVQNPNIQAAIKAMESQNKAVI